MDLQYDKMNILSRKMTHRESRQIKVGILCIILGAQIGLGNYIAKNESAWVETPNDDPIWSSEFIKVISFGHLPSTIDGLTIQAFLDPAYRRIKGGGVTALYRRLNRVSDLDPAYFDLYYAGANVLAVILGDGVGARDLLLKGSNFLTKELPGYPEPFKAKVWSRAWSLYVVLAYVYLFELEDLNLASHAFLEAAKYSEAPSYLFHLKNRIEKPGGRYEVGLRVLNTLRQNAIRAKSDEEVIKELDQKIKNLSVAQFIFEINFKFLQFQKRHPGKTQAQIWAVFQQRSDPWGGTLSLNKEGKLITSTTFEPVFGLH